jgi:hypothetical protein
VQASGEYFATVGVQPALGRFFGPADDELPAGNDVVVLSHAYWQRRFAGQPGAIGQQLLVNDQMLTVIGLAPRGFNGTDLGSIDLFVPLTTAFGIVAPDGGAIPRVRVCLGLARLRTGVTPAAAGALASQAIREIVVPSAGRDAPSVSLESVVPGPSARQSPQARVALWLSGRVDGRAAHRHGERRDAAACSRAPGVAATSPSA